MSQRNPFKFLDAYTLADRDLFFGRDLEIAELYSTFFSHRLSVIYGESGTGKTSLIQCGLQAEIPEEDVLFIPVRSAIGALKSLEKEVRKQLDDIPDDDTIDQLLEELWYQESRTLVLVLDQFEEFFLFRSKAERLEFSQRLAHWLTHCPYIRVIISIREDYYARLSELEAQLPELYSNRLWVRRMSREQAREVIIQPCKICHIDIESSLSDKLLDDLTQDDKEIDLPILQVVLDTLYNQAKENNQKADQQSTIQLKLADYQDMGKISKILAHFINLRLKAHGEQAEALRQVLKAFISAQGTRKTSKLKEIQQRLESFGINSKPAKLKQQLQKLCDDRIISEDNGLYELRHDSLAKTIYQWLSGTEKELINIRQDLDSRYQEYKKRKTLLDKDFLKLLSPYEEHLYLNKTMQGFVDKSRKAQRRKIQRVLAGVIITLLVSLATVSILWYQAEQQRQVAELAEQKAQNERQVAKQAEQKALDERRRAIELINYMNFDLRDKLKPIGRLDILNGVQQQVYQYFDSIEINRHLS